MFTIDLAAELKGSGVTVNALHPATYMNTTMVREGGITPISTVEQGGEAILHLAAGDDVAGKTGYSSTVCSKRKPIRRPMMQPPAHSSASSVWP
jgi:NAD(P)-dependent dehydrogenase (short-subunit alcohol dehydrogenase family)